MNTAVEETILKMQEAKDNFPNIGFDDEFIRGFNKAFQMAIFIAEKVGKEQEKQQIIEAVDFALEDANLYETFRNLRSGEQYYKETYETKTSN